MYGLSPRSALEASLPCHGYPLEKVRVCTPCDAVAKREVMLHRRHLPMLRRGDQFVKYGMIRQRDVNLLFDADSMNLRSVCATYPVSLGCTVSCGPVLPCSHSQWFARVILPTIVILIVIPGASAHPPPRYLHLLMPPLLFSPYAFPRRPQVHQRRRLAAARQDHRPARCGGRGQGARLWD